MAVQIGLELEQILPPSRIIDDLKYELFSLMEKNSATITLEKRIVIVTPETEFHLIAYIYQHGYFLHEASHIRVTIGIGKTVSWSGVAIPDICFARLYYSLGLELQTIDYYEQIS
jgi:hypothetical protein